MDTNKAENRKEALYRQLLALLDERIAETRLALTHARESRDNDTKSSAGDKYETGRAMMQQEMDKLEHQQSLYLQHRAGITAISTDTVHLKVGPGTLVETNHGTYFVGPGLGKVNLEKGSCFVISPASPLGKVLKDKTRGDRFVFQGRDYVITALE